MNLPPLIPIKKTLIAFYLKALFVNKNCVGLEVKK